jgi:hypothetical protein
MLTAAAADIFECKEPESVLSNLILQNMHSRVRSHLLFSSKLATISELYSVTSQVAKAMPLKISDARSNPQHSNTGLCPISMAVGFGSLLAMVLDGGFP